MSEYGARDETRAYYNDRENQMRDMAKWPCNHSLTLMDAARICYAGNPELLARLERANKIDRLKAELRQKAEELRALADSPNEPLSNAELDRMLADLAHDHETESRAYPTKLNPHDE